MKTLGSIKIEEKTIENMLSAIDKYNKENLVKMQQADFRRLGIELLAQFILQDMKIPFNLKGD